MDSRGYQADAGPFWMGTISLDNFQIYFKGSRVIIQLRVFREEKKKDEILLLDVCFFEIR